MALLSRRRVGTTCMESSIVSPSQEEGFTNVEYFDGSQAEAQSKNLPPPRTKGSRTWSTSTGPRPRRSPRISPLPGRRVHERGVLRRVPGRSAVQDVGVATGRETEDLVCLVGSYKNRKSWLLRDSCGYVDMVGRLAKLRKISSRRNQRVFCEFGKKVSRKEDPEI